MPRLIDALKREKFRPEIIYTLGRIGPAAAPATEALSKFVEDKNSRVANEAIIALGDIGPARRKPCRRWSRRSRSRATWT